MSQPSEFEARLARVEARVEEVYEDPETPLGAPRREVRRLSTLALDAAAARHLAAAQDRDLADLAVKVDANRKAINALGVQTAARFDRLEGRFDRLEEKVDRGFAEMRGKLDGTAAGLARIIGLLDRPGSQGS